MIKIRAASFPGDSTIVRQLFLEYSQALDIDLGFQDFQAELDCLPGKYEPPSGRLILAWVDGRLAGCVALRAIDRDTCEMKRLYVKPGMRALKLGRRLAERICDEAYAAGYKRICLDTLPTMSAALALYSGLGFRPIEPYVYNPIEGAIFLGRDL
jgi:GNAT superfamily N-acetyltransferase